MPAHPRQGLEARQAEGQGRLLPIHSDREPDEPAPDTQARVLSYVLLASGVRSGFSAVRNLNRLVPHAAIVILR
jgi:hypothetical protein